jgi:malonyl-CoA reductase/3-hydroxypropionate dehydrogenase (NADP+)
MITAIASNENAPTGRIIFLIGEAHLEHLGEMLGAYLGQPDIERVVLLTATPAVAAWVAAPYALHREEGRLVTVLAGDDLDAAVHVARRGWGEPDVVIKTAFERRPSFAPLGMSHAAD